MKNIFRNLKKRLLCYLDKMAEANKKTYGSGKLYCCELNKKNKHEDEKLSHS